MQCPRCRAENRHEARFCRECGVTFSSACPSCGAKVEAGSRFCDGCGAPLAAASPPATGLSHLASPESYTPKHLAEKILTSKAALEGERKQVTVLFADLKGSMELLADRDPEEARKILDVVLDRMMDAVHRFEGTVNQVMGDGIMALFGAPVAHEDHAVRACYAALRMQELVKRYAEEARHAHGVSIQIRVGLNSGEVVVRAIGSDLRMDYTAVGQTTHLAARMEQLAAPGSIIVTPSTLALVEGLVAVRSLGSAPIKGLAEPLEIFEVTGVGVARTRLHAAARRGLTRFVGRDSELEQLWQAQELAGKWRGQIVALVGEAGVGKSRLAYEFTRSHRLQGWLILEAVSVSYGKATSYLPVIAFLKSYFKIQDRDDLRDIREKITGKLLTLDEGLRPLLPPILGLLDMPVKDQQWTSLDPQQRRKRTLDAVKRLLLRESQVQPLLVVFEDLHWIDGETQALLDGLVESLGSARLLLLVNYRPEYQHAWAGKTYYGQLRLDALPPESAADLLSALLGEDSSLDPLKQLLVKRGNPFFVEETVRTLVETGALAGERGQYRLTQPIGTIQIPPTVQVMLAARIDRLPPEAKRLLQVAAVIGKDVPVELLQAVADLPGEALGRGLNHLKAAEFVYEAGLFPDLEYTFKHALTHEVAYGGLLQERRLTLHARVVTAIEALHRDRLDEQIERLAHHAVRGELRDKAVQYLRQAGNKAAARSALQDARAWFEQALDTLGVLPDSQSVLEQAFEIRFELRPVLALLGEVKRALERLREAEILAERLNDDRRRGRACALMTVIHYQVGELDEAQASGTRALAISRMLRDVDLHIASTSFLASVYSLRGEYEQAVELATDSLAALPADRAEERLGYAAPASINGRYVLIMSLAQLGRFAEAAEYEAEASRLAKSTQHAFTVGTAHNAAGTLYLLKGDWAQAHLQFEAWLAVVRAGNIALLLPYAVASSAWVLAELGQANEAQGRLREAEQLIDRHAARGIVHYIGWAYCSLGRASMRLGRLDEARRLSGRAVELSPRHFGFTAHALHLLGDIATHPDRFDAERGEAHYRQALALAEPRGMRPLIAHCHLGLGKLDGSTGKRQEAQEHLTSAATMYREMDMRFWLDQAEAEIRRQV